MVSTAGRIAFVIEGGRSRADHAALFAVANAVAEAGIAVEVLHHGLGMLSMRAVRKGLRRHTPDVIVTSGAASTHDTARLSRRTDVPIVCYYWPDGKVEDIHHRTREGRPRKQRVVMPAHAVVGSAEQRQALGRYLEQSKGAATLASERVHLLAPPVDSHKLGEEMLRDRTLAATLAGAKRGRHPTAGETKPRSLASPLIPQAVLAPHVELLRKILEESRKHRVAKKADKMTSRLLSRLRRLLGRSTPPA